MPMMQINVAPLGTAQPSVSEYVIAAVRTLAATEDVTYEITPMGTVVEAASVGQLFTVAEAMHDSLFGEGAQRVVTTITIDDRRDRPLTAKGKVEKVRAGLNRSDK